MEQWKRAPVAALAVSVALGLGPTAALAATETKSATVSASIAARASLALQRDTNSVTRFSAAQVVFDRYDDQDGLAAADDPDPNFMYSPYRSEAGKNWHVARIIANGGTQTTLTMTVTGNVGTGAGAKTLASVLSVFCGGFFQDGSATPISGTKSSNWEAAQGFSKQVTGQTFTGTVPFNYRLSAAGVPAGQYSGNITFTLTST